MAILITGGAGFIGSHFTRRMVNQGRRVVVLDKLTYAGNLENLKDVTEDAKTSKLLRFYKGDICDQGLVERILSEEGIDTIVNFAAESHVDRSISCASTFIDTDMKGVFVLLEASKQFTINKFIQISTDEVYGTAHHGAFKETDALNPSNPYAASKAGGDRLAYAYWVTYKLPIIIIPGHPITTVHINIRRNSFLSLLQMHWKTKSCRCMAMGNRCGTGFTLTTIVRLLIFS